MFNKVFLLALLVTLSVAVEYDQDEALNECRCARNLYWICASNGLTYSNRCVFDCKNRLLKERNQAAITVVRNATCDATDGAH